MRKMAIKIKPSEGDKMPEREWLVSRICVCGGDCRFGSPCVANGSKSREMWASRARKSCAG